MRGDESWPESSYADEVRRTGALHLVACQDEPPAGMSVRVAAEYYDELGDNRVVLIADHPWRPGTVYRLSLHEARVVAQMLLEAARAIESCPQIEHCACCGEPMPDCECQRCPKCGYAIADSEHCHCDLSDVDVEAGE